MEGFILRICKNIKNSRMTGLYKKAIFENFRKASVLESLES